MHTFEPSPWEAEAGGSEFKASLVSRVSSRIAKATQRNSQKKERKGEGGEQTDKPEKNKRKLI